MTTLTTFPDLCFDQDSSEEGAITHLLAAWGQGESDKLEEVLPLVFDDLRRVARNCCHRMPSPDFQATELVNQIYFKLHKQGRTRWTCRSQFYRFAALLMERELISSFRHHHTQKRGGHCTTVSLSDLGTAAAEAEMELPSTDGDEPSAHTSRWLDIVRALRDLQALDPRMAEVVRLRYLLGLTIGETAEAMEISEKTVTRAWRHAKRLLLKELAPYGDP